MPSPPKLREVVKVFSGQKSSYGHPILQPGDAESVINFVIRKGRLRKIWGCSLYAQPVIPEAGGGIRWIDRFRNRWIYQQGRYVGYETEEGSKVFETLGTIVDNPTADSRIRSEKHQNRIYMVNGMEAKFYEDSLLSGEKFLSLGIYPPGNGAFPGDSPDIVLSQDGSSGTLAGATEYSYLITWWDSVREVESLPNGAYVQEDGLWLGTNPASITTTAANRTITGDVAALKAAGYDTDRVTHFIVYRAAQSDGTFKRINNVGDGLFLIANDTFTDSDGDETLLGQVLDQSLSPPPTGRYYNAPNSAGDYGPRFIKEFNNQLFLFGVRYPGNGELAYGAANGLAYGSVVGSFDQFQYSYNVGFASDEKDTGIAKYRNTLFFIKERSIYYLDGTNALNYQVRPIDSQRGVVAPGSIQETPAGVIGLSADGFILIDSTGPAKLIGEEIFDQIGGINFAASAKINSAYDPREGKYECHIPMLPLANVSKVFVYDTVLQTWNFYTKRLGQASVYGIDSNGDKVGLLGDFQNSRLYNLVDQSQVTFNGQKILGRWASKHFDFGDPEQQKRLQTIRIKARSVEQFSLFIDIIMDFGQQETMTFEVPAESIFSQWADGPDDEEGMDWDDDAWAGATVPIKFEIDGPLGVARNFQIVIREEGEDAGSGNFEIEEIVLVADALGR